MVEADLLLAAEVRYLLRPLQCFDVISQCTVLVLNRCPYGRVVDTADGSRFGRLWWQLKPACVTAIWESASAPHGGRLQGSARGVQARFFLRWLR